MAPLFENKVVAAMRAHVVTPETETEALLAGAQFVDAYQLEIEGPALNAPTAARRILGRAPHWVSLLMALRNRVVAPWGLKTPAPDALESSKQIRTASFLASRISISIFVWSWMSLTPAIPVA